MLSSLLGASTQAFAQYWRIAPNGGYVWQPAPSEFQRQREFTEQPVFPHQIPALVSEPDSLLIVPGTSTLRLVPRPEVPQSDDYDNPGAEEDDDQ
jgi:hypothetical protein